MLLPLRVLCLALAMLLAGMLCAQTPNVGVVKVRKPKNYNLVGMWHANYNDPEGSQVVWTFNDDSTWTNTLYRGKQLIRQKAPYKFVSGGQWSLRKDTLRLILTRISKGAVNDEPPVVMSVEQLSTNRLELAYRWRGARNLPLKRIVFGQESGYVPKFPMVRARKSDRRERGLSNNTAQND